MDDNTLPVDPTMPVADGDTGQTVPAEPAVEEPMLGETPATETPAMEPEETTEEGADEMDDEEATL